jgi:conjugative transfer signal peptidase TraF
MLQKTHGRCKRIAMCLMGFGGIVLVVSCVTGAILGVRVNTSYSLPMGLYIATSDPAATLIEFCPADPFARESSERGYRTPGITCPDGAVPLLKPIVARDGDHVEMTPVGIKVNGALLPKTAPLAKDALSRPLMPWPCGIYQVEPGTVWVASTYHRGSYDSRYMGPISVSQIRQRLKPLWVL